MSARTEVPPGILALDALAGQLLLRAGVRIGVAHTIVELGAVHRLRHRDVSAETCARSERARRLEPDPYDDHALQLAAWRGTALVATMRLVLPVPAARLPTEDAFDLEIEPRGEVVDVGRPARRPRRPGRLRPTARGAACSRSPGRRRAPAATR